MRVDFVEEVVQTFPKGFENWRFYRVEYGGHAEDCLFESHIWLPPNAKIKDLTNLFVSGQQSTWEEYKAELEKLPKKKLLRNRIKCKKCGDIVESRYRHDFASCKCEAVFTDGGLDYMRVGGDLEDIEDLSEWKEL